MSSTLLEQLQRSLGGTYRLEYELGGGGMSRVFVALETALGRRVVVKVLLPELVAGVNVERFRREIQLAAQLQHPHIVPLLAAGEADGLPYFIMPFVTGESLRKRLMREGELPIAETVRILRGVVSALAYAHAHGVIHRDVKPDNVLLSGGVAVVTDFGVAKAVSASSDPGVTGLTSVGVALGTPAYMAPEQATANPNTDHRADIYAVGVVAYELLTGSQPFAGRSPQAVLAAHVVEDPEPVERRRPAVPPLLATLVRDCLAKRPAERPQTAAQVMHVLDAIATPTAGTAATTAVRLPALPTRTGKRPVLMAVALAMLLGAGGLWLRQAGRGTVASQETAARGHTGATLSHAESASTQPPAPQQETTGAARPALPSSATTVLTQPSKSARPDPARRRTPRRPPEPVRESISNPPTAAGLVRDSVASVAVAPGPPAIAPQAPEAVAESATPAPRATVLPVPLAPPRPIDPAPEINRVIAEYAGAIEAQSLARLQRVYPRMTAPQAHGWEQFFQLVRDVKAQLSVARLDVDGAAAEAHVSGTYTYLNTSTGRAESQPVSFQVAFKNESGRWQISAVK